MLEAAWIEIHQVHRRRHYAFHHVEIAAVVQVTKRNYIVINMTINIKISDYVAVDEHQNHDAYQQSVSAKIIL